jgi:protein-tyrosine phosphatase
MTGESILVVCAANVCRSPLAELALRRGLGADSAISVSSAGVRAVEGDAICALVSSSHDDGEWGEQARAHRARPVTIDLIEQSSLILTASRDIRGELVRLAPRSRDWMFTLKEAAHLGAGFSSAGPDRVADYVAYLDRARSRSMPLANTVGVGQRVRRLLGNRGVADAVSIADRHGGRGHRETLDEVQASSATILAQLGGYRRHAS